MWTLDCQLPDGTAASVRAGSDGTVVCSPALGTLLQQHLGEQFAPVPSTPLTLSLDDPASIVAAVLELTRITGSSGDVPAIAPPLPDGAVG